MKDRVSKYPGRALITPEDGSAPFYATITRADEPTQAGDPLNKNTFLKDETATLFGLDETAVPDLVFQQIPDAIGTIKTTVRADMPENWLLCNGASVRAEGYEELADVLADTWPEQTFDELFPDQGAVAYENGVWVKCGFDDARQIIVLYKSGLTEEWNRVETGITLSTDRSISGNVYYSGGRWLLRIDRSSSNAYVGGIDMCTAETLTGPWRYKPVYDYSSSSARIGNVIFADGYYAVVATTSHKDTPATCSLRLLYADDSGFDANSWTNITLRTQDLSRGAAGVAELFYSDGKWIVQSNMPTRDSSDNYTVPNRALQMAQSLSGNWSDIPSPGVMSGLEHINGRWEATLAADHSRACTDELTSGWTIKSEQWGLAKVQGYIVERGIEFSTSSVARAFNYRAFGQAFQTNNASASLVPSTNTAPFRPIACIDKEIFFSNNVVIGRLPPGFVLPAIATDGAYTYIKANEGADR